MGANNFIAFATVPAGAQVGPKAAVDLWALVPATGLDPGFNVMCTGEFRGTIAVEGSLTGTEFNPVGSFTLGSPQLVGPFEPTFELAPVVVDEVVRYLRLRVMPGTVVTGAVFVTAGGAQNCDCNTGGGGPDPYDLDPENVDNSLISPGIVVEYSRGDHVHGLTFSDETPVSSVVSAATPTDPGISLWPARADHVHNLADDIITGYLSQIYAAGVAHVPTVDNVLVGSYFNIDLHNDGSERIDQNVVDNTAGQDHFARRVTRWIHDPWQGQTDEFIMANDSTTSEGALYQRYWIENTAGGPSFRNYGITRFQLQANPNHDEWYVPQIPGGGLLTRYNLSMVIARDNSLHENIFDWNSDGAFIQRIIPPSNVTPYAIAANYTDLFSTANPPDGTAVGYWSNKLSQFNTFLDHYDGGSGHADAHFDFWLFNVAGGGVRTRSLQIFPPDDAYKSTAGVSSLSYTAAGAVNRMSLSNNAGAYSPIMTLADLAPTTATSVVDIVSSVQNFKTATTFTVVPSAAGRKFLPVHAYVEFTTVTGFITGPTLKLGNDGAHANVAPAFAVAAAATADADPFVMAATPVIIDLNATGIICELTVNATGTTISGRIHVIGVYTA